MNDDAQDPRVLLSLARIEGKLELIDSRLDGLTQVGTDHEARLRDLEKRPAGITPRVFLSAMVGISAIVGSISPIIALAASK